MDYIIAVHKKNKKAIELNQKIISDVDIRLIEMNTPKDFRFSNPDNILKEMDISFENVCTSMEEAGIHQPKKLSQFEFLQRMAYLHKKHKKANKE